MSFPLLPLLLLPGREGSRRRALTLVFSLALPAAAFAADWPHWRGPNRNGIQAEPSGWTGAPWPGRQPLWTARVGAGAAPPAVAGGRLYAIGWSEGKERVVCLDAASGRPLWEQSYSAPEYGRHATGDQGFYSGVSAAPELDPATGLLYTLGIDGELRCWDTRESGRLVWHLNLYDRFSVPRRPQATRRGDSRRDYGYTASPLVHGEWVIVEAGAAEGTLVAFDRRTGERRWTSECRLPAGHSGGLSPMTVEGIPCAAVLTLNGLLVARLDAGHEGKTLAFYEWITDFANNIPTPAVLGASVVLTTRYNQNRIARLDVSPGGVRKVWEQPYPSGVCSPVIYRDRVYFASRGLHCLDFTTGELKWEGGRFGDVASCIVTSDGRIVVWANEGDLALAESAERSPDRYTELALLPRVFAAEVWPHVVLAGGRLFCKDRAGNLKCFAVR